MGTLGVGRDVVFVAKRGGVLTGVAVKSGRPGAPAKPGTPPPGADMLAASLGWPPRVDKRLQERPGAPDNPGNSPVDGLVGQGMIGDGGLVAGQVDGG